MSSERFLRDLEALLDERSRAAWARASGEGSPEIAPGLVDRLPDLTSDDALRELAVTAEGAAAGDPRWWRLVAAEREALTHRCRQPELAVQERVGRLRLESRIDLPPPEEVEIVLARTDKAGERDVLVPGLERMSVVLAEGAAALIAARREARPDGLAEVRPWARARGRDPDRIRGMASELLERTDDEFAEACAALRRQHGGRNGGQGAWVDLPRFLAGDHFIASAPAPDAELLRFVLGRLALEHAIGGRLRLAQGRAPQRTPRAGVYALEPGRRVIAAWTGMGRMRDYRGLLEVTGRALPIALLEDGHGARGRHRDPAAEYLFGALFEDLAASDGWIASALRGAVPAAWSRSARVYGWLRLRQLAAQVLEPWDAPAAYAPALVQGDSLSRATGFAHPDGCSPWSDTPSAAADELVGRLVAVELEDVLAARYGRPWTVSAAGRFLRDVWAAGQFGSLDRVAADLQLGGVSLEAVLELRRPILI